MALKLIRPGLIGAAMLRRFEYEPSLLARLDHPGIARIYHADIFDAGHGRWSRGSLASYTTPIPPSPITRCIGRRVHPRDKPKPRLNPRSVARHHRTEPLSTRASNHSCRPDALNLSAPPRRSSCRSLDGRCTR